MKVSVAVVFCTLALFAVAEAKKVVVCYYGSWAVYRQGGGKVDVTNIDPKLCTHMVYTFVGLTAEGNIRLFDSWRDLDLKGFSNLRAMKNENKDLKILAAIGGWNEASDRFTKVAASPSLRKDFAKNALKFVEENGLDGFDMDWEYPADRGGSPADKANFVLMLQELRAAFGQKYLLTAAVGAGKWRRESSYDVPGMNKHVDFIHLMSYDLHGSWESKTGHNAPLKASSSGQDDCLNIECIIKDWLAAGASKSKLVVGMGLYGRTFTLANPSNSGFNAPAAGAGQMGKYTREAGSLSYTEICANFKQSNWKRVWDNDQQVPYAYSGNQWVGYDDAQSLALKCDAIIKNDLAGGMVWSVEQDDVHNECGDGAFPLLRAINSKLNGGVAPPPAPTTSKPNSPTQAPTQGPTQRTTSAPNSKPSGPFKCTEAGYLADPSDCGKFYLCQTAADSSPISFACGPGLLFDKAIRVCNFPALVKC